MKRTISLLELNHKVYEAKNGEEALHFLEESTIVPDIILLDLNMPKIGGIEFLKIIKSKENLRHIPTIILTTSSNQKDLVECYRTGMAGYVLKPLKYEEYVKKIEKLFEYWTVNELKKS